MESGVEPAFRGRKLFSRFVLANVLWTVLRYPTRPIWFFACFVHPSAYVSCIRHAPELWPRPGEEAPASMTGLMQSVVEAFHMTPTDRPGVFQVGWITRGAHAPGRVCPEAAWYMDRNPGYLDGHGLLTVMPVSLNHLAAAALSVARSRLARLFAYPAISNAPVGST